MNILASNFITQSPGISAELYYCLLQSKPVSELYNEVRKITGKQVIVLLWDDNLIEETDNQLQSEVFDGVQLKMSTTITLFVYVTKQYAIHISPVS